MSNVNVYVWQDVPNWGDQLGFTIIAHFFKDHGDLQQVDSIKQANLVGIGSTLGHISLDWEGIIAGTGSLKPGHYSFNRKTKVLGVRGQYSLYGNADPWYPLNPHVTTVGDPGLITPSVFPKIDEKPAYDIGVLPHWSDTALKYDSRFLGPWTTKFINPFNRPQQVVEEIQSCAKLVTSSLHGTIIADAYGIPRRIVPAWSMLHNPNEGGMFKFKDYMSAIDMEYQPEALEKADHQTVERVQADILHMYTHLPQYFNDNSNNNRSSNNS